MNGIAKTFEEVGKKPIDFQSFNHIIFGFVAYIITFSIMFCFFNFELIVIWGWSAFISLTAGVAWEIVENLGLPDAFFRIWGMDSLENSLMDIFFDFIGVIIGFVLSWFDWKIILIFGFILTILLVFTMYVLMKITQPNNNNKKEG